MEELVEKIKKRNRESEEYKKLNKDINENFRSKLKEQKTKPIDNTTRDNKNINVLRKKLSKATKM